MLAYVFWHRPATTIDVHEYERAQRTFHEALGVTSACFRVARLPFADEPGYEDWYLVEDWTALGQLNAGAVDASRRPSHDAAASGSADGWGSVYELVKGPPSIPDGTEWRHKPRGESSDRFLASLPAAPVWRRQLVLGPAPELCLATAPSPQRVRIWPEP